MVNIVPGYGATAGQHLAEHPGVDKIAFTGSTAIGRKIVEASAGNLKRVQLELGGKGANIVFDDASLPAAVNGAAFAIFHNQGQACIAGLAPASCTRRSPTRSSRASSRWRARSGSAIRWIRRRRWGRSRRRSTAIACSPT